MCMCVRVCVGAGMLVSVSVCVGVCMLVYLYVCGVCRHGMCVQMYDVCVDVKNYVCV